VEADAAGAWLAGRVNASNLGEAQRIWKLVTPGYVPVDWQLDFKSGFRWREDSWYLDSAISTGFPGADIKLPWELARCQHLPQLAFAYALAQAGVTGFRDAATYAAEYRNQVLDFVACNPPRHGVNWRCAMDVAIRAVNWLVAHDLFCAAGARFDPPFETVLARSTREHGRHIAANLEWVDGIQNNHYLANVVGLLFAAAFLGRGGESDTWAAFALSELIHEVQEQFLGDGANHEGSVCYHRLSAEMAAFGTAMALALARGRGKIDGRPDARFLPSAPAHRIRRARGVGARGLQFPASYADTLERMAEFTIHATNHLDCVVQTGDNDSGRFLKLQPSYEPLSVARAIEKYANLDGYADLPSDAPFWDERMLDHRHLVGGIAAFFDRADFMRFAGPFVLDRAILESYSGGGRLRAAGAVAAGASAARAGRGSAPEFEALSSRLERLGAGMKLVYRVALEQPVSLGSIEAFAYPDFGLYILRGPGLYLAMRCGSHRHRGHGGHFHNDQLAVELVIGGHAVATDPGTYVYTPLPHRRNAYRSVRAHFAPWVKDREPAALDEHPFILRDRSSATCLYFDEGRFAGFYTAYGAAVYRLVECRGGEVLVRDYSEGAPLEPCRFGSRNGAVTRAEGPAISPKYGCLLR
jgi:hypothetical protein